MSIAGALGIAVSVKIWLLFPALLVYVAGSALPIFTLSLLKSAMKAKPSLKIVLMSATVDKEIFLSYFGGASKAAHVHIEGRTFPVTDHHLEDILPVIDLIPSMKNDVSFSIGKAISSLGSGINYELIMSMIVYMRP